MDPERGRRKGDVQGLQRLGLRLLPGGSRAAVFCRVGLIRPIDAMGNYPIQPKYSRLWKAMEETGMVYGMHPFPAFGSLKPPGYTEQHSSAELIGQTVTSSGLPHSFLTNVQNFQAEASLWVAMVLMTGFFGRSPKLKAG